MVILQKYTLLEFELHNELSEHKPGSFQLKPHINFNVLPKKDNQPMIGEMTIEIGSMDDNSPLYLKLRMRGNFLCVAQGENNPLMDIKDFHRQAFPIMFDTMRTFIAGTTLMGGMAPFNLPPINPDQINFAGNQ